MPMPPCPSREVSWYLPSWLPTRVLSRLAIPGLDIGSVGAPAGWDELRSAMKGSS